MVTTSLDRPPAMHPAERRRIRALLPPEPAHDVILRPLGAGDGRAMIISAREESFLDAVFDDLQASDWRARLAGRRRIRVGRDDVLELGLPIHRHFQLVLFEAVCRVPGFPPVDPRKLVGMGLVLRRVEADGSVCGWMKAGEQPRGWKRAAPNIAGSDEPDPDPALRVPGPGTANGQIAALIAARRGSGKPLGEEMLPLFVAPQNVCAARGRTIVYGIVGVASSDKAATEAGPDFNDLLPEDELAVVGHLSEYLKARPLLSMPGPGVPLDPAWHVLQTPPPGDVDAARRSALGTFLYQLQTELGALDGSAAGNALLGELAKLTLVFTRDAANRPTETAAASDWVVAAARILIAGEANAGNRIRMPLEWPEVSRDAGAQLTRLARNCLSARFRALIAETPKFDRDDARYVVRGFVRVAGHAHCAPQLAWSGYSESFRILPWWDSDAPAARIALPTLGKLKGVKPNVTFEMPPALANLLQGDMKKLATGDGSPPSELGIGWLCSFSIPIITLCAFICLNIFLSLLDIVFFWMAFLKICIPYPKSKP